MITDGITDLLLGVLILGVTLAVAFGFIIPLVNSDFMEYTSDYEDKGVSANIQNISERILISDMNEQAYYKSTNSTTNFLYIDESPDALTGADLYATLERVYTYQELMLLLAVQDSSMPQPNTLSMRNLLPTAKSYLITNGEVDFYLDDYDISKQKETALDINGLVVSGGTTSFNTALLSSVKYFCDNHVDKLLPGSTTVSVDPAKGNRGFFTINDAFNGIKLLIPDDQGFNRGHNNTYIEKNKEDEPLYLVKYEFAIDKKYLGLTDDEYKRSKYNEDIWAIEVVQNPKTIESGTYTSGINTLKQYSNFLVDVQAVADNY